MAVPAKTFVAWCQAILWASLPWVALWFPWLIPMMVAAAVILASLLGRDHRDPWPMSLVLSAALLFLGIHATWQVAAGWLLLGCITAVVSRFLPRGRSVWPGAPELLALGSWGVVFVLAPDLLEPSSGGWLAPAVLLLAASKLARGWGSHLRTAGGPTPPIREVRGTLSLEGVVLAGVDGLPRTVPIDLELRPGQSVAIVCDSPEDTEALAAGISGRNRLCAGGITIDGAPMRDGEGLVAVVAPGAHFLPGDLTTNLGALCTEALDRSSRAALFDSCSLAEVADALGDDRIDEDGAPLTVFHRMLVLVARIIPSQYHVVVVVDPVPWVDAVRREIWRSAVVRASLGRTTIWITPDLELAYRATEVLEFRDGALRQLKS